MTQFTHLFAREALLLCLLFSCLLHVQAQDKPPVIKTQLKPTFNMAVVQLHIKGPDGKPYANQKLIIIEGGARATKTHGTTNDKGIVEFLVRRRRAYRVDFLGATRPKALLVPDKPKHRFRVNLHLKELNPENLFIHLTNCDTGLPMPNAKVVIQNAQKKGGYKGKTDKNGIAKFRIKLNARYRVVVAGGAYPIYPSFRVRGGNLSELFTIEDLHFGKEFHYHYQTRCTPPSSSGRSGSSSGIAQVFKRNPQWKNALVVLSGGWFDDHFKMYKEFMKTHNIQKHTQMVVCPHCHICEPSDKKNFNPLIPKSTNPKIKLTRIVNGDLLSIVQGLRQNPGAKDVVLVTARNYISNAEKVLFGNIKVPVKIILVNVRSIHPGYLALAKATGGSIHTLKADITQFSKLVIGQVKVIDGVKYKLISPTNFIVVK